MNQNFLWMLFSFSECFLWHLCSQNWSTIYVNCTLLKFPESFLLLIFPQKDWLKRCQKFRWLLSLFTESIKLTMNLCLHKLFHGFAVYLLFESKLVYLCLFRGWNSDLLSWCCRTFWPCTSHFFPNGSQKGRVLVANVFIGTPNQLFSIAAKRWR